MQAVRADARLTERPSEQAVGLDVEIVDEQIARFAVMRLANDALDMQVLPQRPAARDVQHLDAAADAQRGQAVPDGPRSELQLDLVQLRHEREVAVLARDGPIPSWLHVRAAWQKESIEQPVMEPQAPDG